MLIHNLVYNRLDGATESELTYATDDDGFWLLQVEIELLYKLFYSLRRGDGSIRHDCAMIRECSKMPCHRQPTRRRW
jgi:hypothetical protein